MKPEGGLKANCRKIAKKRHLIFWNIEGKGINGIPDTLCGKVGGGVAFVEFKRPDGKGVVSVQQGLRVADLRAVGVEAWIVDSVGAYVSIIEGTML